MPHSILNFFETVILFPFNIFFLASALWYRILLRQPFCSFQFMRKMVFFQSISLIMISLFASVCLRLELQRWPLCKTNALRKITQHATEWWFSAVLVFESDGLTIALIECTSDSLQTLSAPSVAWQICEQKSKKYLLVKLGYPI